ncbi:MAG: glycosyltransferase family 2 protein [Candidatus Omnitrophica bacterium]|nr:glycosyltransferase family 2 protein [Candidatus Omnitrophota bacterium]
MMAEYDPCNFSIVVFAKNEALNLPSVIHQLLQKYPVEKIVVIVDGDIESMAAILTEKNIKFIEGPNKGKGAALRTAIEAVESDILVFMDADGSHDPNEIGNLVAPLANNEADLVIGSRFLGGSDEFFSNAADIIRYSGNVIGNYIINSLWNRTGKKISDAQNGFRAIKRTIFLGGGLIENSFSIEQEMVIKCLKKGHRISEVPSFEMKRKFGRSHISFFHLFDYIRCMIRNILDLNS